MNGMPDLCRLEVPISGMDCAECTRHVRKAIETIPGVESVEVFLAAEKALVRLDPDRVGVKDIQQAVARAGYRAGTPDGSVSRRFPGFRRALAIFGLVVGTVVFLLVLGEWLGLLRAAEAIVPWWIALLLILGGGYPVFRGVIRAAASARVTSHTLMSLGALAAVVAGEWATAAVVVFFMRLGAAVEGFTTDRARGALRDLMRLAPQVARVVRGDEEIEVPIAEVRVGETVVVRPGAKIPVDGTVLSGNAAVDHAMITGEGLPLDAGPGAKVFAAGLVQGGSLRLVAERIGRESTFGRVVKIIEESEAKPSHVQRFADRFTAYFLPIVATVALLTFLVRQDPMATVAVLVVACSCSIALATPIAVLASVGAAARQGLLIKGGRALEALTQSSVLLLDKTGTLTLGQPHICRLVPLPPFTETDLLRLASSAERYSEHPLADAVRRAAFEREIGAEEPEDFRSEPGVGVTARVAGTEVFVGKALAATMPEPLVDCCTSLQGQGLTVLQVRVNGQAAGLLAAEDKLREDIPRSIARLKSLGLERIELLTGDHEITAQRVAGRLGIDFRAGLLPEDKIRAVEEYQAQGKIVVMVGDGVNDAPALARADVGIAMGAAGSDIALEASNVSLMTDDWTLVPALFELGGRTMGIVRANLIFTGIYNLTGILLAAFGILPPLLAAAAQSLPDVGILVNSSRLLRWKARQAGNGLNSKPVV
jgi:P-type Cu+ transporter